jgi:hypothetical protein
MIFSENRCSLFRIMLQPAELNVARGATFVALCTFPAGTDQVTDRTTTMGYRRGGFVLTPPSLMIFVIALILALFAMLVHYTHMPVPVVSATHAFDALAIAYVVLTIGVLFRGV